MQLWRLSAWLGFAGVGGLRAAGRWNPLGVPVVYAAEHPALAVLESLAHLHLTVDNIPTSLKLIQIEVADDAAIAPVPSLPNGWQANEVTTQAVGGAWLRAVDELLLPVPSAIVPHATNYLLNPLHPQASTHLAETVVEPFWFDSRFIR